MENVIVAIFENESTTYQVLSELKTRQGDSTVLEAGIVQNAGGTLVVKDGWTSAENRSSWAAGGLIGGLVGVLGGPVGMLLGASLGMLVGDAADAGDIMDQTGLIEQAAHDLQDQHLALILVADEPVAKELDEYLTGQGARQVIRRDVAAVQGEIYQAEDAAKELRKQARAKMREEKKAEWHQKAQDVQGKVKGEFEKLKSKVTS